jgi:hypothetical protein
LETRIKRQKQKKKVRKYVTRNADKMSGFKHSIKKQSKGGGGKMKPAWNKCVPVQDMVKFMGLAMPLLYILGDDFTETDFILILIQFDAKIFFDRVQIV